MYTYLSKLYNLYKYCNFPISFIDQDFKIEYIKDCHQNINFNDLSSHINFKIDWVSRYPDKEWDWSAISRQPFLNLEWVFQFPDKDWGFKYINTVLYTRNTYSNKDITLKLIENFNHKPLDWPSISKRSWFIDNELFEKYSDKWDYYNLSSNNNVRSTILDWILKNPLKEWDWAYIYTSLPLSTEMIHKFPEGIWLYPRITPCNNGVNRRYLTKQELLLLNSWINKPHTVVKSCENTNS